MVAVTLCTLAYIMVAQTAAMPTVQVVQFTKLEQQLNSAVASGDQQAAVSLLTSDFAEWTPQPPGAPMGRDEWLSRAANPLVQSHIRQMAVKQIDDHALVDFVLSSGAGQFFVVDLWRKDGSAWKLQQRYRSKIDRAAYPSTLPPRKD